MIGYWFLALLLGPDTGVRLMQFQSRTLTIRRQTILRVPARKAAPTLKWREKKGPKCVEASELRGAAVIEDDAIDMILQGGKRVRAELEGRCPALAFYSGFYLRPGDDGRMCADRDAVHTRAGAQCRITRFRTLLPPRER